MEVLGGSQNKFFVLISELLGTAFVMMAVNWGGVSDRTPQCVGFIVFVLAQIFGSISGGHFNPAVTVGMLFKLGKGHWVRNFAMAFAMIIAQGLGGLLGAAITAGGFSFEKQGSVSKVPVEGYHVTQLCPSGGCNDEGAIIPKVLFCEAVCTFLFVSMVLMITRENGSKVTSVNALAIGTSLFLAIQMASGISGGCINPVVGLIQSLFQKMANTSIYPNAPETSMVYIPCYVFGPFLGGFVAGMWHKWIHEKAIASADSAKGEEFEKFE